MCSSSGGRQLPIPIAWKVSTPSSSAMTESGSKPCTSLWNRWLETAFHGRQEPRPSHIAYTLPLPLAAGQLLFPGGPGRTTNPTHFTSLMDDVTERIFHHSQCVGAGVTRPEPTMKLTRQTLTW